MKYGCPFTSIHCAVTHGLNSHGWRDVSLSVPPSSHGDGCVLPVRAPLSARGSGLSPQGVLTDEAAA